MIIIPRREYKTFYSYRVVSWEQRQDLYLDCTFRTGCSHFVTQQGRSRIAFLSHFCPSWRTLYMLLYCAFFARLPRRAFGSFDVPFLVRLCGSCLLLACAVLCRFASRSSFFLSVYLYQRHAVDGFCIGVVFALIWLGHRSRSPGVVINVDHARPPGRGGGFSGSGSHIVVITDSRSTSSKRPSLRPAVAAFCPSVDLGRETHLPPSALGCRGSFAASFSFGATQVQAHGAGRYAARQRVPAGRSDRATPRPS